MADETPRDPFLTEQDDWRRGLQHGRQLNRALLDIVDDQDLTPEETCEALDAALSSLGFDDLAWMVTVWLEAYIAGDLLMLWFPEAGDDE